MFTELNKNVVMSSTSVGSTATETPSGNDTKKNNTGRIVRSTTSVASTTTEKPAVNYTKKNITGRISRYYC